MKSTSSRLLNRRPARVAPFRNMLDEGDGKEGDLNVRLRNEQWKTFMDGKTRNPRHLHHCRRQHGERDIFATDLAVLRKAASHRKMNWFKSTGKPGETLGASMLSILSQDKNEFIICASSAQFMLVDHSKMGLERILVPSSDQRSNTVSAGLAYGSDVFRMMKNEIVGV